MSALSNRQDRSQRLVSAPSQFLVIRKLPCAISVWLRRLDLNPGAMHALISAGSCVNQITVKAAVFQTPAAPSGAHGLNLCAINHYLRYIAVTAAEQRAYI